MVTMWKVFPASSVKHKCFLDPHTGEDEEPHMENICVESRVKESQKEPEEEKEKEGEEKRERTRSRSSSTSSEDYIIILPDCFDTSRPLGESMYRYKPCALGNNSGCHCAVTIGVIMEVCACKKWLHIHTVYLLRFILYIR